MFANWKSVWRGLACGLMLAIGLPAMAGTSATDFTLRDINGQSMSLSQHKGEVIVLSFWATWCGPCKEEMPHLQKMYDELKEQGLLVVSVSTDDARTASRVKQFIRTMRYDFPVLLDRDSTVIASYNPTKTLPYTVVIDRNFEIAKIHTGYNPGDEVELRHLIESLLAVNSEAGSTEGKAEPAAEPTPAAPAE
jgi:peroxiredoxin